MFYIKACCMCSRCIMYVLPVIEYASNVWSLHYAADICKVERIQCKFTKRLLGCSKLRYAARLARLKLESLKVGRLRHDLILTYKILMGITDMNQSDFFTFADRTTVQEVIYLSIYPIYLSIHLSIHPSIHPSIHLSIRAT